MLFPSCPNKMNVLSVPEYREYVKNFGFKGELLLGGPCDCGLPVSYAHVVLHKTFIDQSLSCGDIRCIRSHWPDIMVNLNKV